MTNEKYASTWPLMYFIRFVLNSVTHFKHRINIWRQKRSWHSVMRKPPLHFGVHILTEVFMCIISWTNIQLLFFSRISILKYKYFGIYCTCIFYKSLFIAIITWTASTVKRISIQIKRKYCNVTLLKVCTLSAIWIEIWIEIELNRIKVKPANAVKAKVSH